MKRMLIADDNKDNLYLLEILLKSNGLEVFSALNGAEALEIGHRQEVDLIISDILMPVMDGFNLCRAVKSDNALCHIPFVFYTATYTDKKDEEYALALGAELFIRKPIQPDLLLDQINDLFRQRDRRPKAYQKASLKDEVESYKLYSERLIQKLEKKMSDLESEITRRKTVENELRKARNQWRETFQAIGSPAFLLSPDYTILYANRFATKALQTTQENLVGKKCFAVMHQADTPPQSCPMEKLLKSGTREYVKNEMYALGGTYLVNCSPLKNEMGEIEKVIHIAIDISERTKIENQLKESEEKFRQLVENIKEIFWIKDAQNQSIRYISPMFEKIFNMPAANIYNDPQAFVNTIMEDDKKIVRKAHDDQVEYGKNTDIVYRIAVDGQMRWIRSREFPIRNNCGAIVRIAGIAEEITEARQAEEKQKQLEAQLIQTQRMEAIGTLAGGIAHDFNNILSSILGFTELALDDLEPGSILHQNISEVLGAGQRAKDLVKQILTLAQKSSNDFKPVNVYKITKEVLKLIRASIPANIEIIQHLDSNGLVLAPATQIHQVLMNLLTNAAQALEENGGIIRVSLSDVTLAHRPNAGSTPFKPGNYLRLIISDTGVGIAQRDLNRIFEPYFTTKRMGKGTGLGLAITHGIIQRCGGYISVKSVVSSGTTFTIFLPATGKKQDTKLKPQNHPTGTGRILVVDDEPAIAKLMVQRLNRLGYEVVSCTDGIEALAVFNASRNKFDLVITDMMMPQMTGDNLAAELIRIRSDLPIILCTGYSKRVSDESAAKIGVDALLMKPVSMQALADTVGKVLKAQGVGKK